MRRRPAELARLVLPAQPVLLVVPVLLVLTVACARRELHLRADQPLASANEVALNQPLVLEFDGPVDPGSVRAETVEVERVPDGAPVAGRFEIEGAHVSFHPREPLRADLADAGLAANTRYRVVVPGLPRLRCVRRRDGAPLAEGRVFEFTSCREPRFVDPVPGPPSLRQGSVRLENGRVLLRFSEPLDPRPLARARVQLYGPPWSRKSHPEEDPILPAHLVENEETALLELEVGPTLPVPLVTGESYDIRLDRDALRDLGGQPLSLDRDDDYVRLEHAAKGDS